MKLSVPSFALDQTLDERRDNESVSEPKLVPAPSATCVSRDVSSTARRVGLCRPVSRKTRILH